MADSFVNKQEVHIDITADVRAENDRLKKDLDDANGIIAQLRDQVKGLKADVADTNAAFEDFKHNTGVTALEEQVDHLRGALQDARREFDAFLTANQLKEAIPYNTYNELKENIEEGYMTTGEAIANIKADFGHLLQSSGGALDSDISTTFLAKLNSISSAIDQVISKLTVMETEGVKAVGSVSGSGAGDIAATMDRIREAATGMTGETSQAYETITRLVESLSGLAGVDVNGLRGISAVTSNIAALAQGSVGTKSIENIVNLVQKLQALAGAGTLNFRFDLSGLTVLNELNIRKGPITNLNAFLDSLAKNLPQLDISKLQELSTIDMSKFAKSFKIDKGTVDTVKNLVDVTKSVGDLSKIVDAITNQQEKEQKAREAEAKKQQRQFEKIYGSTDAVGMSTYATRVSALQVSEDQRKSLTGALQNVSVARAAYDDAFGKGDMQAASAAMQDLISKYQEFQALYKSLASSASAAHVFEKQASALADLKTRAQDYFKQFGSNIAKNPELLNRWTSFFESLNKPDAINNVDNLKTGLAELTQQSQAFGAEAESAGHKMASLFGRHFNMAIIMAAISGLRRALRLLWQDIREVDDALVQTQIVTGLSGTALEQYTDKAYDAAASSRDTITNILDSATAFGRLGYDSDLSVELARLTSMFSKLGDVETGDATDAITALMKAFNLDDASEIEAALDKVIYVGNNFPISAAGLGEGLNNAASALSAAGNSLEETLALLMAANATVQNPAKASTAMRTITARIRNTTAELEDLGEEMDAEYDTTAKYRDQLKALSGVDILDKTGKEFRSTYDILSDLAAVWDTLGSTEQAAITTMVAGTRNQDIFASLMKNFPDAMLAMTGMTDAAGLMQDKFSAVESSISGAIAGLSNAFSQFSTNLVNSKDIVKAIEGITELVKALDGLRNYFGAGGLLVSGSLFAPLVNSMKSLDFAQLRSLAGLLNTTGAGQQDAWQSVINSMATLNPQARQTIVNLSGLDASAKAAFTSMAQGAGYTLSASNAMGTLSASMQNAKLGFQNLVASGNIYILMIQAAILAISYLIRRQERQAEAARQRRAEELADAKASIQSANSLLSQYDTDTASVDSYLEQLRNIQTVLQQTEEGSDEYKQAQTDLIDVNQRIVDQFGEEASAIQAVTGDLAAYAVALDEIRAKQRWEELTNDTEGAAGVASMLRYYGLDENGKAVKSEEPLTVEMGVEFDFTTKKAGPYWKEEAQAYLNELFGDAAPLLYSDATVLEGVRTGEDGITKIYTSLDNLTMLDVGDTIEAITLLTERWKELSEAGDASAGTIRDIVNILKTTIGYSDVVSLFEEWADLQMRFGQSASSADYNEALLYQAAFDSAIKSGDIEAAHEAYVAFMNSINSAIGSAYNSGETWALEYLRGVRNAFYTNGQQAMQVLDSGTSGLTRLGTVHTNEGHGLDTSKPFSEPSALAATGAVASVKTATENLFDAETVFDRIKETFESGAEVAEEDIDAIKDYVGDTFDEINEESLASIEQTLGESRDEINTANEEMANNAIHWMEKNVEGFNLADYINPDTSEIDMSGILAAFQNADVEGVAGATGTAAALAYQSGLQTAGSATLRAVADADGLGFHTEFSGGNASGAAAPKKGGGGGGGGKKKNSDLENLERLIELFKELQNYYEEGSDQWISRQTQIIDKYKAGVEIATNEYNKLIKKGKKQTDDEVQELADTILEYQKNIFEESEALWEAVRQNQIDSLQHTLDQNDAAIQLEETHHDLLKTIRDERRELEDELKAARNAYSEVMTPQELDALFSEEDYVDLMDRLSSIEGDAMAMYRDYKDQIANVSEDETYLIEHITDEFERQYELKMKEYEIAKAELGVARAQQELENARNEQSVMMLKDGMWQWVADPKAVLDAEQKLADAQQELADAQDEYTFQSMVKSMEANSSEIQKQIDALEALTFSMDELANQIHLFTDTIYKELLSYLSSSAQASFAKFEGSTAVPAFASGGVIAKSGLAMVHAGEPIFGTDDAVKLWRLVHALDVGDISMGQTMSGLSRMVGSTGFTGTGNVGGSLIDQSITINGMTVDGDNAQQLITVLRQIVAPYTPSI